MKEAKACWLLGLHCRFDIYIFIVNYSSVEYNIFVDNKIFLIINFMNIKIS
jgi:hypothetical protein